MLFDRLPVFSHIFSLPRPIKHKKNRSRRESLARAVTSDATITPLTTRQPIPATYKRTYTDDYKTDRPITWNIGGPKAGLRLSLSGVDTSVMRGSASDALLTLDFRCSLPQDASAICSAPSDSIPAKLSAFIPRPKDYQR